MRTRARAKSRSRARKRPPVAPPRMPGLNFDTFEHDVERHEGAYGTDRALSYQARYAAEFPRRYIRRFLNWLRGRPAKARGRRYKRRAAPRGRAHASRIPKRRRARRTLH